MRYALILLLCALSQQATAGETASKSAWRSALYPQNWTTSLTDSSGRFLHDFSYAGYHNGTVPLPESLPGDTFDVTAYGADKTGATDATASIQAAIDAAQAEGGGIVYFPAGLYRCDGTLLVSASNMVLRGENSSTARLYFTRFDGMQYGAHLLFQGNVQTEAPLPLTQDGSNRSRIAYVNDTATLASGDDVAAGFTMSEAFFADHGMTGLWPETYLNQWIPMFQRNVSSVASQGPPYKVTVDVPLRYPLKTRDQAALRRQTGYLEECGVEHLGLANAVAWDDAWTQIGVAMLRFSGVKDSWIRDVVSFVSPADPQKKYHLQNIGINIAGSKRVTVSQCRLELSQNMGPGGCGYLFLTSGTSDVLFRDCVGVKGRHNFIDGSGFCTSGTVYLRCESAGGKVWNTPIDTFPLTGFADFHNKLAVACLVDSCTIRDGWQGGNRRSYSEHAGHTCTQNVFWNNKGNDTGVLESWAFGWGYIIGTEGLMVRTALDISPFAYGTEPEDYVEGKGLGNNLLPRSLYEDQLARRTGQPTEGEAEGDDEGEPEGEPEGEGLPDGEGEPTAVEIDVDTILEELNDNVILRAIAADFYDFNLLPDEGDLNGNVDLTFFTTSPNGMYDSYELALIATVLDNPAFDRSSTGGVTHAQTYWAYANNRDRILHDIGFTLIFAPNAEQIFASFMILGDDGSVDVVRDISQMNADVFPRDVFPIQLGKYIRLPQFYGPDGDADGDGYTNREEYDAIDDIVFNPPLEGRAAYVAAALNPAIHPNDGEGEGSVEGEGGNEGEGEGEGTEEGEGQIEFFTLTQVVLPNDTAGRIIPQPDLTPPYPEGTRVRIAAAAKTGWVFDRWEGNVEDTHANPAYITMNDDETVTAYFKAKYILTVALEGQGSVTPTPGAHEYLDGTQVALEATPADHWRFDHWEGPVANTANASTTITVTESATVRAVFVQEHYTLTIATQGEGTTDPAAGTYEHPYGTQVPLAATPAETWQFARWEGTVADTAAANTTVTVNGDTTVTAIFEEIPPEPKFFLCAPSAANTANNGLSDILVLATAAIAVLLLRAKGIQ